MISASAGPREWAPLPYDRSAADALAAELGLPPALGALLWQRDLRDPDEARSFLRPSLLELHPPGTIVDLEAAAERLLAAGRAGETICIYGDYDVDGVTGTAILVEALAELGIAARTYIPHRLEEGYGLNRAAITALREEGVDLLVTVDGGSNDPEELELARSIGLEVIVTDHHPVEGDVPAPFVVHPGRPDAPSESAELCGAGVAYKLAWGLGLAAAGGDRVSSRFRSFLEEALALAALGTVADIVSLLGENRAIVVHGLRALARTPRPGIRALLSVCSIDPARLSATDIGFRLAPHINAAGRMGQVEIALELLLTRDDARAGSLARNLAGLNRRRKEIEQGMVDACLVQVEERGLPEGRTPVLFADEGWHSGVAGIVAARLAERLHRPVFVVALDAEIGRGSARSTPDLPLTDIYEVLRPSALSVGGHAHAGGVSLEPGRLEEFRAALVASAVRPAHAVAPRTYDLSLQAADVTLELARGLSALAPFGAGHPEPLLRIDGLAVEGTPRLVGRTEEHLQVRFRGRGAPIDGIWFRGASSAAPFGARRGPHSVVGVLEEDVFRGRSRVRLRLVDRLESETSVAPAE